MLTSETGSIWRKWDLHIHTPFTKLNNNFNVTDSEDIWEIYSEKIEQSDVSVFGITDYFSCDNFFKFLGKFKSYYPDSKKLFFPNIEFRLDVAVNKKAEEVNIHVIFSQDVLKNKIDDFLTLLETNLTDNNDVIISCKNLNSNQFESATVKLDKICECLAKVFGKEKQYIILAAANNTGLRPVSNSPRKLSITDEIDKKCDAFFGGQQNVEYYFDINRYETDDLAKPKPVVSGCDAHSITEIDQWLGKYVERTNNEGKTEILKSITWIKSDLSFEGLKQILFEPEFRVKINENQPRKAFRRITSLEFDFPLSTKIKRTDSENEQDFCLKQLKKPIYFSDYFTCIIGGRGTGKSTIINLLAEKLGERTDFFNNSNNSLLINDKPYNIEDDANNLIKIEGTNEIEFVSQGKIERLAEGNELTKLIFNERIKEIESRFIIIEIEFKEKMVLIKENIDALFLHIQYLNDKELKTKELEKVQKVVDSINDEKYIQITTKIKELKEELTSIENSQRSYKVLIEHIRNIVLDFTPNDTPNIIDNRIQEIITQFKNLQEISASEEEIKIELMKFEQIELRIEEIKNSLGQETKNLREFFEEKGTNEETIKDSQKASEDLSRIKLELLDINSNDKRLKEKFDENTQKINLLPLLNQRNKDLIESNLNDINKKLTLDNDNVLRINFAYEFDIQRYQNELFNDFYNTFNKYHISGTSKQSVQEVLFLIEPNEELLDVKYDDFKENLNRLLEAKGFRRNNNYVKIILDIFQVNSNYAIYRHLIIKHIYNLSKYIKIKGFYDNRELEACSFGQKCTAVIVTLLMTGVKPLVIDEPEAHLDNKLIADYLVGLIKKKQLDRQIIFASHNSNFVINGDSGLIHILEIPHSGLFTSNTSTTIENKLYREQLLKLEGGREAFITRESKYGI